MKTERRHELQSNELAGALTGLVDTVRPYSTAILGVLLAAVVLTGVAMYLSNRSRAEQAESWDKLFAANSPEMKPEERQEEMLSIAESQGERTVGIWARLLVADEQLNQGIDNLFTDRAEAEDQLRQAAENYQLALDAADDDFLRQHAIVGLARTYESQNELEKAREQYQALIDGWPKGTYEEYSRQRLDDLGRAGTKAFYDWFAQQKPVVPDTPGVPGMTPDMNLDDLPNFPLDGDGTGGGASDRAFPDLTDGDATSTPDESSSATDPDGETEPASPLESGDEPSGEAPLGDEPDGDAAPADETVPADETATSDESR